VKTGHTLGAGYVLVGAGRRKGIELISAVLGAPSETERDLDTIALLDYGFSLYRQRRPLRAGQELATPEVRYSGGELPLRAARGVAVGLRRGQDLSVRVDAPAEVEGPLARGRALGSAVVYVDGRRTAEVDLVASRSLPAASSFDKVRSFVEENLAALAVGGFVILIAGVFLRRRRHRTKDEEVERLRREERRAARERERVGGSRR
jgi:D-alanyl-D-alanine carboxypeptidase (penicillin-binding protein 5/6)